MDMNARFCQILLKQAMADLTGREAEHFRRHCSALKMTSLSRGYYLVEWRDAGDGGDTFTMEVQADNVAHAKATAINDWLEYFAEGKRAAGWPPRPLTPR